jgi:sulfatase maturation enzyme AslB (radical SAM superfamily)
MDRSISTKSIHISNMCVPCFCHCKYCLLSYEYILEGIDYHKGMEYAKRFQNWLLSKYPEVSFMYYFGYSMETPFLIDSFEELIGLNSPITSFMQFNGMKKRTRENLVEFLSKLKENGVKLIDLTFYGMETTHDDFAQRKGDFNYLLQTLKCAKEIGLNTEASIAITKSNTLEVDLLVETLESITNRIFIFTPHCGGKGSNIILDKISVEDYNNLAPKSKQYFDRFKNKTPNEWVVSNLQKAKERVITLSLLPSNIEALESESFDKTYKRLEKMDDDFYTVIPSFEELLNVYVDSNDDRLYTQKDLYAHYRRRYIIDHNLGIKDIDERYSYSIRL